MASGFAALKRELQKLDKELGDTLTAHASQQAEDQQFDEVIRQALVEADLPPRSSDEIDQLSMAFRTAVMPTEVSIALKQEWEQRFGRSSVVAEPEYSYGQVALAFRKNDAGLSNEDHEAVEKAISRFRQDLKEKAKKTK